MPYRDMREYLAALESAGEAAAGAAGSGSYLGIVLRSPMDVPGASEEERFGLVFEKIKGFSIPVMTGVLGASRDPTRSPSRPSRI